MNFVDRVLLFHSRPSVVRFRLKCIHYNDRIGAPEFDTLRIDGWIRAVMWHSIQELELDITESDINLEFLPASLFTCETLVVLKLCLVSGYDSFEFPSKVCLPRLKILHICVGFSNAESVERMFLVAQFLRI
ncbi:hypothetical protein SLA2020_196230 [Shorea laevis]